MEESFLEGRLDQVKDSLRRPIYRMTLENSGITSLYVVNDRKLF